MGNNRLYCLKKALFILIPFIYFLTSHSYASSVEVKSWGSVCSTHGLTEEMPYLIERYGGGYANDIRKMVNVNLHWKNIGLTNTPKSLESLKGRIIKRFDKEGCNTLVESSYMGEPLFLYMEFDGLEVLSYRCEDVVIETSQIARKGGGQAAIVKAFREFMGKVDKTLSSSTFEKYNNISVSLAAKNGVEAQVVKADIIKNTLQECRRVPDSSFEDVLNQTINRVNR